MITLNSSSGNPQQWYDTRIIPNQDGFQLTVLRKTTGGSKRVHTKVVKDIDTLCHTLEINFPFSEIIGWFPGHI